MNPALKRFLAEYPLQDGARAAWLLEQQDAAIEAAKAVGFPTRKMEDWKYTDVRPILEREFRFTGEIPPVRDGETVAAARIADLDSHELVFVNGRPAPDAPSRAGLPAGVTVRSLAEVLEHEPGLVRDHLNRYAAAAGNAFSALNTAFLREGAVVVVPEGVAVERPIHLLYVTQTPDPTFACTPRNLVVLGRHAKATLIETWFGRAPGEYFTNAVTEAAVGEGACLEHYRLQQESANGYHVGAVQAVLSRDSRFVSHSISLGARLARIDIGVRLPEPGAEAALYGLYLAGDGQHVDHHTRIDHLAPRTGSREIYRGVIGGRSRGVFNGKILVHPGAQKTDARLANANLLLSDDAEADAKPELEIYADDVKCAHGATVGRLDENMLYYLRTRAIPEPLARSLLTFAFAEDVIGRIALPGLRARLGQAVAGRLPDADLIREFIQ